MVNQNFRITFVMREDIYFQFKEICKKEKKKPAFVIRELVSKYVKDNKDLIREKEE